MFNAEFLVPFILGLSVPFVIMAILTWVFLIIKVYRYIRLKNMAKEKLIEEANKEDKSKTVAENTPFPTN